MKKFLSLALASACPGLARLRRRQAASDRHPGRRHQPRPCCSCGTRGILTLKEGVGLSATERHRREPLNVKVVAMEAANLPCQPER